MFAALIVKKTAFLWYYMDNRSSLWLVGIVLVAMMALFTLKLAPFFQRLEPATGHLSAIDVEAVEVTHKGLPYILNMDQQEELVTLLNGSLPVKSEESPTSSTIPAVEKITIYRFDLPTLELRPLFYIGNDLVYAAPAWNHNGNMRDVSQGALKELLAKSFDP